MTCKTEAMNLKKIKNDFDNLRIALHCSKCSLKVYFFGVRFKGSEKIRTTNNIAYYDGHTIDHYIHNENTDCDIESCNQIIMKKACL